MKTFASCCFIATVAFLTLINAATCEVNSITRVCRFEGCYDLDENDPRYSGKDYHRKLSHLFSSGIPQLIYGDVQNLTTHLRSSLSKTCVHHLEEASKAIDNGREWAFRLIDSSGKTPSAFLKGTVSSLGDYDECLAIRTPDSDISGQYCMVDVFPRAYKWGTNLKSGQISLEAPRHYNESAYYFGLCFPSGCSTSDVRALVTKVLEPFPLLVKGEITCDTTESISWKSQLLNMRFGTLVSLLFLAGVLSSVAWGTFSHVFNGEKATELQRSFSAVENVQKLFQKSSPSSASNRTEVFDLLKTVIIWSGATSHIIVCIESLIGTFVVGSQLNFSKWMSDPLLSAFVNEAGIIIMSFISGATTFMIAYPLALKGRLPFKLALLDRVLRHLPGLVAITALDFTWHLFGSGPFYTRVGRYQVEKCSKTWWENFLFVSNLWGPASEICAGHTFFSSVDVQLFVLGFVAIILLAKRPKLGVTYCLTSIAVSSSLLYYYTAKYDLTPTMMASKNPSIPKIEQFFTYIHMPTSGYATAYFGAILTCYTVTLGWWTRFSTNINHLFWLGLIALLHNVQQTMPVIPNGLDMLSREWTPFFIVFIRLVITLEVSVAVIYMSLFEKNPPNMSDDVNTLKNTRKSNKQSTPSGPGSLSGFEIKGWRLPAISAPRIFVRLSFAVYLSNYYFIRSDFFNERTTYPNSLFSLTKRIISSYVFMFVTAFVFHVIFLGPFINLRIALFREKASEKKVI